LTRKYFVTHHARFLAALLFLVLFFCSPFAAWAEIKIIPWEELSDRDISPQGKAALSLNREGWKHAETEHFVYHFTDVKNAETVYLHAEIYYQWIKKMFGIEKDEWSKKGQLFIFEDPKIWEGFNHENGEPLFAAEAFTTGWELFIYRAPFWLSPQKTLAHEITHIVLFRFLDGPIPIFLNEGFAEFVAFKAIAVQAGGDEYRLRVLQLVPADRYIPLEKLICMRSYPTDEIDIFYRESELLVRFLIKQNGSDGFYSLLKKVSGGRPFEKALRDAQGTDLAVFEEQFKSYALEKK